MQLALVEGPQLQRDARNPRRTEIAIGRGSIVARDGTPLALTRNGRRVYPLGDITAHAIGYASARYGTSGLEDAFDRILTARAAANDPGTQFNELLHGSRGAPRGADLVTTLDPIVQRALAMQLAQHERAAGIVLDPRTGAVLALAAVPSFDPNTIDRRFAALRTDPASPLLDRSTNGLYPPGSTFKIVTLAEALDDGVVTPQSTFVDTGGFTIGSFTVRNDEEETTGTQNLAGAFALSSNVDFAQIGLKLGVDRWFADAAKWRLGDSLDFDLPTARDRLPARAGTSDTILAQLAFGQASLLVTPLRMALVGATIANAGTTPRPFLVRSIAGADTRLATRAEALAQPISADTAATVRDMMVGVVAHGTGTAAALPGVTVAGKTGTATNPHGAAHAWFVGFAPAAAPRVVVAVVVENAGYGGTVAAPIVRELLRVALAQQRT